MKYAYMFLALLLLSSWLVSSPIQAESNALGWLAIEKPGEDGNLVVSPSEVSDVAVGRYDVVYTIDSENSKVFRSFNSGLNWEDITDNLTDDGAELPPNKVTIAPDDPDVVAVVADDGTAVYLSTDGGENWTNTSVPSLTGTIQAIAFSEEYTAGGDDYREIAIGTAEWGDSSTTGQLWVYQIGSYPLSWQDQELTID
ncbi:WD40/YVTN/BNR-like repeat-containing protein, partial [Chloroflexota bacterium]